MLHTRKKAAIRIVAFYNLAEILPMVKFLDLHQINLRYKEVIREDTNQLLNSGWYLKGKATEEFEHNYAQYIGHRYAIGCASGLDALRLILRGYITLGILREGDEVIVPANTFIASILAITDNNLNPVFCDVDSQNLLPDAAQIESLITARTRAIMIVHLYGRCAYSDAIGDLCKRHQILLIEDNAQAHGCITQTSSYSLPIFNQAPVIDGKRSYNLPRINQENNFQQIKSGIVLKKTGSIGHAAGHSFYPGKNLGALGDAGCVTTNDKKLAEVIRSIANYGMGQKYYCKYLGINSRIDEWQALILNAKLPHLDEDNNRRIAIAQLYYDSINNIHVRLPRHMKENVYHVFPIFCSKRDSLQLHLNKCGIETLIHYPIPPHLQACYSEFNHLSMPVTEELARTELSIPISPVMSDKEVQQVIKAINSFSL